jgi:hypothetical protein
MRHVTPRDFPVKSAFKRAPSHKFALQMSPSPIEQEDREIALRKIHPGRPYAVVKVNAGISRKS